MTEFRESKRQALSLLRQVAQVADGAGAETLAHKLRDDRIPRLESERFHLVVLGEFNHGKTTFVNALLGSDVLPVGVTPTTAVIHHLEHGDEPSATAVGIDGSRASVPMERLQRYVVDGEASAEGVRHIEVRHPAALLEGGVVLVDTPGVNDLNEARAEITYGYVPQSDAVLFLLDAGQILKESERAFVAGKLLSQSRDKVLFVVNKLDLLDEREREEALAYTKATLGNLIGSPRIYGVSAKEAVQGRRDASGIDAFVSDLRAFLQDERGRVLLDNALAEGLGTSQTLRTSLEVQRRAVAMEQQELDRRLEALEADIEASEERVAERQQQVRDEISGVRAVVREDCRAFGERVAAAAPAAIEQSDAKDLKRYLGTFVEEKMREFAEEEGQEVARRLEVVADKAVAFVSEDAQAQAKKLQETLGEGAPKLELDVSTFAYDVGVFALGAFGVTLMAFSNFLVGGAMTLAAPVLAWLVRGRVDKRVKERAAEEAPQVVREAAEKMGEAFAARIDDFGEQLAQFIAQANRDMTRSLAEVVRRVRDARNAGESELQQLESTAGMSLSRLAEADREMEHLRKSLRANGHDR
ncbi:MAG: dynamin family protein [Polyangiales bacterium]